jgi:hypothetical protein
MTDQWEEHTESALGADEHHSFDLNIDFSTLPPPTSGDLSPRSALHKLWPEPGQDGRAKDLVVFDPLGYSVAADLRKLGYPTREVSSGVDVMTGIAAHPTAAVVCGPAEDGEQRRLLTAAIRLRFPEVPIVYASTHGRNPAAVRGALAEGAHIVLPLPLPTREEIEPAFADYIRPITAPVPLPAVPDEPPQETLALGRDELERLLAANPARAKPASSLARAVETPAPVLVSVAPSVDVNISDFEAATDIIDVQEIAHVVPQSAAPASSVFLRRSDLPTHESSERKPPEQRDDGGRAEPFVAGLQRGEVGELLRAISPFLWGLDDAARYMDVRAAMGDVGAQGHQRTLKLLGNLLRQLQKRIDDSGL